MCSMGDTKIPVAVVFAVVSILSYGLRNAEGATCSIDSDCKPQVVCQVITWECNNTGSTPTTPIPGQSKACCEYLNTCDKGDSASGWVWSRETTREYKGKNHHSDWTDMYVSDANETFITSQYAGSWNTFNENCTSCDLQEAQIPTEIYVLEPISQCGEAERHYPEWYQIALAAKDSDLNVSGLILDEAENRSCLCDVSYTCGEDKMCKYQTDLEVGEQPNSTVPESAEKQMCTKIQGIERGIGTINASSIFASGYDVDTARFNAWVDADSVEGGWAPNFNDLQKWIKVTFDWEIWISGIITQGLALNLEKRVDSFILEYQNKSDEWYTIGQQSKVFYAGARYDTKVINYFSEPVRAIALLMHILTPCDPGYIGLRFELLGCDVCYNNSMCAPSGLCLETGACSFEGLILNQENYDKGLDVLQANNGTLDEKKAYDTIVGYLGPSENLTTIVFENVTVTVAKAAIAALTNISAQGNRSKSETGALAIQKIEVLAAVLGNEQTAAFQNLDTPKKLEEAKGVIDDVVNLVDNIFSDDNANGWDLMADIAVGNYDPNANTEGAGGGAGGGGGGAGETTTADGGADGGASGGNSVQSSSFTEEEQKEQAKAKSATIMVDSVSSMILVVAEQQPAESSVIHIQKENIEVYAERSTPDKLEDEGFNYPPGGKGDKSPLGAKVTVHASSFNFDGANGTAKVVAAVVIIDTLALRSFGGSSSVETDPSRGVSQPYGRLASDFISISFNRDGKALSVPVSYSMNVDRDVFTDIPQGAREEPKCVYHDTSIKNEFVFSSEKLQVVNHEKGAVKKADGTLKDKVDCKSGHLTTFAVLMYLSDVESGLSAWDLEVQEFITKICSGLSILALVAAIGVLIYLRHSLMSDRIIIHLTLMITTLLATLGFMFGIDRTTPTVLCKIITILLHFLYTAIFSWMLVEGVHLYRQIITVFNSEKSRLWIYFVLGWGVPVVIVVVAAGVEWDKYGLDYCFLKYSDNTLWAFVGPIIPVILINFIILCRVARVVVMAAKLNDTGDGAIDTVNRVKSGLRSSIMLLPILGITWVVGFIQHLTPVLSYVFVVLNSLQGFFMALFHCAMSSEVRGAIQQHLKKARDSSFAGQASTANGNSNSTAVSNGLTRNNKVVPECQIQDVD